MSAETPEQELDAILRAADGYWPVARERLVERLAAAWDEGVIAACENVTRDLFEGGERIRNPYRPTDEKGTGDER